MSYTYSDELFSDLHKDAYGFRPGGAGFNCWNAMTPDQKQARWDQMVIDLATNEENRAREEEANAIDFVIAMDFAMSETPGLTQRQYVISMMEENMALDDPDFLCYKLGLKYGFLDKFLKG